MIRFTPALSAGIVAGGAYAAVNWHKYSFTPPESFWYWVALAVFAVPFLLAFHRQEASAGKRESASERIAFRFGKYLQRIRRNRRHNR